MNVVPRSTMSTDKWWNRELTLKCKLKCYVKPMKDPLGVSPCKGNQGTTRGKEKKIHSSKFFLVMASSTERNLLDEREGVSGGGC